MFARILIALLLAPALALLPLPVAGAHHECPPPAAVPVGTLYTGASVGSNNWGANVMGYGVRENFFEWPSGAAAGAWMETNGLEGLQTVADHCGPADTWLAGASAGLGRPFIRI